jgi:hypothetical protein
LIISRVFSKTLVAVSASRTFVKMRLTIAYTLGVSNLALASTSAWVIGQDVVTTSGRIKGSAASRVGYSEVSQYVGIPFAEPPLGALRWMPAKKYLSNATIDATKWVRAPTWESQSNGA